MKVQRSINNEQPKMLEPFSINFKWYSLNKYILDILKFFYFMISREKFYSKLTIFSLRMKKDKQLGNRLVSTEKKEEPGPILKDKSGHILIKILAKPGAKQNAITDVNNEGVGVQINAPPVDGEANKELLKYLSKIFDLRKSDITLDKGSKSRQKIIIISGTNLTIEDITVKLKEEMDT